METGIEKYSIYHDKELGFYSKFTPVHHNVIETALPLVLDAIEHIPFEPTEAFAFYIIDFGAGDGGTSVNLLNRAIGAGENARGKDINGIKNEFSLVQHAHTFVSMCATDFYQQCFPKASVDLGINFSAMHWMRKRPCTLKNNIMVISSDDAAEKQAFTEEGRQNYETIVFHRAKELRPGGRLVLVIPGINKGPLTNFPTYKLIFVHLEKIWNEIYRERYIEKEEYETASFHMYIRTEEEIRSPLEDADSDVYKSGLRLISVETKVASSLFAKLLADEEHVEENSVIFVKSVRSWTNSCFYFALSDQRPEQEKQKIVDELYSRYEQDVIRNPSQHDTLFSSIYVYVRKV